MSPDVRKQIRAKLLEADLSLAQVLRREGYDYSRVERILHGRAKPRPREIEELVKAIDRAAERE